MFAAGVATRPTGLAFRASPASARIAPARPGSSSPRGRALVVRAGKNQKVKKMKASKVNKKRQEFIEADNEKDQLAAQMRAAARAASLVSDPDRSADDDAGRAPGASFEDKLAAVRERGAAAREAKAAAAPTVMDEIIAGGQGGKKLGSIYDRAPEAPSGITLGQVGGKTEEDDELNGLVRVASGILAVGLLLVFLPSDLTAGAPVPQKQLTPEVLEQVKDRAAEYENQLASADAGEVVKGLRGAAERSRKSRI